MSSHSLYVEEFQLAFGVPDPKLQMKLVDEEVKELSEALANALKESCDVIYVMEGLVLAHVAAGSDPNTVEEMQKFVNNTKYLLENMWGSDTFDEAFRRVHASNMSKLVDGKPVRREDGKVLKGPNYRPADLSNLIPF